MSAHRSHMGRVAGHAQRDLRVAQPPAGAAERLSPNVQASVTVGLTPDLLDVLADRVADVLVARGLVEASSVPEPWIGVDHAAEHLACPKSRIYALVSARRIPHHKDGSRVLFRRSE